MNLGEKCIISMLSLSLDKNKVKEVYEIIEPFLDDPIELDLKSICLIESILGESIIRVPTQQDIRRLKLERINKIFNNIEELKYDSNLIKEFYKNYFNNLK